MKELLEYIWMFLGCGIASIILTVAVGLPVMAVITIKEIIATRRFKKDHPDPGVLRED